MLTGKQQARTATSEDTLSEGSQKKDLEFAISMLKVKLHSAKTLSEKIRLYNQIKALQDNISTLKSTGSAHS